MKSFLTRLFILLILLSPTLTAKNSTSLWQLERVNFYFENDIYSGTDEDYTAGMRLSSLYFIENENYPLYNLLFLDYGPHYSYFTLALTNQIFTPVDTKSSELVVDERPYASWTFLEFGMHKSYTHHLLSMLLQVGAVGEISGGHYLQDYAHKLVGNNTPNGWSNQLNNELGINLKGTHKWMFSSNRLKTYEYAVVPFMTVELGNIAIRGTLGTSARFGYNIPKDFGLSSIDIGADPGIATYDNHIKQLQNPWSYSLNLNLAGSYVVRDIFLDGNTFTKSHSVEKEPFVYYYGLGMSFRYRDISLDIMHTYNSKKYKLENRGHGVDTIILSWFYD